MRTARSLTASRSIHQGGACMHGGSTRVWGDKNSVHGGARVGPPSMYAPPRTEFLTHACENITFP